MDGLHMDGLVLERRTDTSSLTRLYQDILMTGDVIYSRLSKKDRAIVDRNKKWFQVNDDKVRCKISLKICEEHCKNNSSCQTPDCEDLHICQNFMLSSECKFRDKCHFGHALSSEHNYTVLTRQMLHGLPIDRIKDIIRQGGRTARTLPSTCSYYNAKGGCTKDEARCPFMHLCKHYLTGDCRFKHCKRSHNIREAQPLRILQRYGIDVNRSTKEILHELRGYMEVVKGSVVGPRKESESDDGQAAAATQTRTISMSDENQDICGYNLIKKCAFGESCKNRHCSMPYQWQFKKGDVWEDFMEKINLNIETFYCDPTKNSLKWRVDTNDWVIEPLDGSTVLDIDGNRYPLRRLSTLPAAKVSSLHLFSTRWRWYWLDANNDWVVYGQKNRLGMESSLSSEDIEEEYVSDSGKDLRFSTSSAEYVLSFSKMQQENIKTGLKRPIRRRPLLVTDLKQEEIKRSKEASTVVPNDQTMTEKKQFPEYWDCTKLPDEGYSQIELSETSNKEELKKIKDLFQKTLPNRRIHSVKRIQNRCLWEDYTIMKERMEKKNKISNERLWLFHGAPTEVHKAICEQGFDWRLAGDRVGTKYGRGSYFARDARFSYSYNQNHLFLVRVLAGQTAKGRPEYKRPPPKNPTKPHDDLYDSCVDNPLDANIYVVFEKWQAYPEYIISFM